MFRKFLIPACFLIATAATAADQPAASAQVAASAAASAAGESKGDHAQDGAKTATGADAGPKALSGMSILGNQEAPKALVIVPWKSSQLGDTLGISKTLDDGRQPVDKEVFMRQLSYYEIRATSK
jgi:hypothetical protein